MLTQSGFEKLVAEVERLLYHCLSQREVIDAAAIRTDFESGDVEFLG
jgi:hypothetical protein